LNGEIRGAGFIGNSDILVGWTLIIAPAKNVVQAVVAAGAVDANGPTAGNHVQRVVAVAIGVRISAIIGVANVVGVHPDSGDGVSVAVLHEASDQLGRNRGGEIRRAIVAGNYNCLILRAEIVCGQTIVVAAPNEADRPRAAGYVQRIIPIGAGIHGFQLVVHFGDR